MPCYHPIKAYRSPTGIKFVPMGAYADISLFNQFSVPCGQCIGCRLEKRRQWAVRIMHEVQMHDVSSFLTLTYDDEHLPEGKTLVKRDVQLFMKRLRKYLEPKKVRYFLSGEYGEECKNCGKSKKLCKCEKFEKGLGRPHYHAVMFGYWPEDCLLYPGSDRKEFKLWTSKKLDAIWKNGNVIVGMVSFDSASYVAKYTTKKMTGEKAQAHYIKRAPEFALMSRKDGKGIGYAWFDKYKKEAFPEGKIFVRGVQCGVPRYYKDLAKKAFTPDMLEKIMFEKSDAKYAAKRFKGNSYDRLEVREKVVNHELEIFNNNSLDI